MLDIDPVLASIHGLVDAAVILLIEHIGNAGMLDNTVNALAIFGIDIRYETRARIAIGKCPGGSAIIRPHASHREIPTHMRSGSE